jgi:hypothetical protein
MNFVVNNQEHFKIQQYTVLTLGTGTIFTNHLPTFHVLALKWYLSTHSFYTVEEFLTLKNDS